MEEEFQIFCDEHGGVTRQLAYKALCQLSKNPTSLEIDNFFNENDITDDEGTISFELFKKLNEKFEVPEKEDLMKALKVFDKDDNGYIDVDELKQILARSYNIREIEVDLSEEYVDDLLKTLLDKADTDGNGQLSIDELAEFLTENRVLDDKTKEQD